MFFTLKNKFDKKSTLKRQTIHLWKSLQRSTAVEVHQTRYASQSPPTFFRRCKNKAENASLPTLDQIIIYKWSKPRDSRLAPSAAGGASVACQIAGPRDDGRALSVSRLIDPSGVVCGRIVCVGASERFVRFSVSGPDIWPDQGSQGSPRARRKHAAEDIPFRGERAALSRRMQRRNRGECRRDPHPHHAKQDRP